jgi:hypothetical protein
VKSERINAVTALVAVCGLLAGCASATVTPAPALSATSPPTVVAVQSPTSANTPTATTAAATTTAATIPAATIQRSPTPATPSTRPATPSPLQAAGTWTATGNMITGRGEHSATLLPDGKVLVAGGESDNSEGPQLASAELYDPGTGTWTATGSMRTPRSWHTATLLRNGEVLVAGGFCDPNKTRGCPAVEDPDGAMAVAELYDPRTGTWRPTGSMTTERFEQTATLLADGKVLVAGAEHRTGILASTELYDPSTGKWTATGSMITARWQQFAVKLGDGKVLMFGGCCLGFPRAEVYDPSTGKWTATGDLITGRAQGGTAALLGDGTVIVAGGDPGGLGPGDPGIASAELFDSSRGTWSATASMSTPRVESASTLLADGRVLVIGGFSGVGAPYALLASAELFDPNTRSWIGAGNMSIARFDFTATLLANGKVLVAGGVLDDDVTSSAELYDPTSGS